MNEMLVENAVSVLKRIKAETKEDDVIADSDIKICVKHGGSAEKGIMVILTLNAKMGYANTLLDVWKIRFQAKDYSLSIKDSKLQVMYFVSLEVNNN